MKSIFLVGLPEMVMCLSKSIDLVDRAVHDHHLRVACIAGALAQEMGITETARRSVILAGALHDIGAFSTKERMATLEFEMAHPHRHADLGFLLLRQFDGLHDAADMVKFHHVPWNHGEGEQIDRLTVPLGSHILHLADRVAVLIRDKHSILQQREAILETVASHEGTLFHPDVVAALMSASAREAFWLDIAHRSMGEILADGLSQLPIILTTDGLLALANIFREIVDFRSPFTAAHSTGVASVAENLSRLMGFSSDNVIKMRVAGLLHDLGKLSIPTAILEKPGPLTKEETMVVRQHTYFTYHLLEPMNGLADVRNWASFHHERLDGTGYPFRFGEEKLDQGAKIMSVADIFTALAEDRPYRRGMQKNEILEILGKMAALRQIDGDIVALLALHFADLEAARIREQEPVIEQYQALINMTDRELPLPA